MRLAIAAPSRERCSRLRDTYVSIIKTTDYFLETDYWYDREDECSIHMYVRIDDDDPQERNYDAEFNNDGTESYVTLLDGKTGKYVQLINEINNRIIVPYDAFMCGTDDIIFEDKGWFEELEKINKKNKYWVAWFNDGEKHEECAQVPIISKAVIDVLGTPLYPKLGHFYGDMWITLLAKHCGIHHYIPTHKIIHMTPKNGRVKEMDSTFIRVRKNEQIVKDLKIFNDSSEDISIAANKIKEAMKNG